MMSARPGESLRQGNIGCLKGLIEASRSPPHVYSSRKNNRFTRCSSALLPGLGEASIDVHSAAESDPFLLVEQLRGQTILAPLTRGNNLPFRRLCAEFGAEVTMSEMGFARQLLKGNPRERAILRRAANERMYGVQIATNAIDEGVAAGKIAAESGATWVDLNCGCPIHEATRRGLGSALLRKPEKLARLVSGIASQLPVPLTVKVRTGGDGDDSINVQRVVELLADSGAAAVTIHGRTAQQRYKRPADWALIQKVAESTSIPVIGNGDVLTHYEAKRRLLNHGCTAIMIGRGALMRPWIFWEVKRNECMDPDAKDRINIYRRLVANMKEHFGDDARGRQKAFYFLPWHLGFLCRHRPLPESVYGDSSLERPLLSRRWDSIACEEAGESVDALSPLERLLRCEHEEAHNVLAAVLWDASSDEEVINCLMTVAQNDLLGWEEDLKLGGGQRSAVSGREQQAQG